MDALNVELPDTNNCYMTAEDFQCQYKYNKDFFLMHINIRSLNKNFEKLEELLIQLGKMPDITAISETKLKLNFSTHLEGHNFIQENSNTNAGGVEMFIKDTINYNVVHHFDLTVDGCKEIWVKINLNNIEKIIGVVYRHPNSHVSDFHKSLETTLKKLNELKSKYFIYGDINIDLLQSSTNVK